MAITPGGLAYLPEFNYSSWAEKESHCSQLFPRSHRALPNLQMIFQWLTFACSSRPQVWLFLGWELNHWSPVFSGFPSPGKVGLEWSQAISSSLISWLKEPKNAPPTSFYEPSNKTSPLVLCSGGEPSGELPRCVWFVLSILTSNRCLLGAEKWKHWMRAHLLASCLSRTGSISLLKKYW